MPPDVAAIEAVGARGGGGPRGIRTRMVSLGPEAVQLERRLEIGRRGGRGVRLVVVVVVVVLAAVVRIRIRIGNTGTGNRDG